MSAGAALLLVAFVVVLATRESGNGSASSSPLIGKLVPPVAGVGINGQFFDIDDHSSRWVLVNF
ncbi:MAG: hypothetical protein ACPHIZ_00360, partial [Acidimicrobiales bacterium]